MATHSSVLAWRIPGMREPGGLPSMGSHRVGHDRSDLAAAHTKSIIFWRPDVCFSKVIIWPAPLPHLLLGETLPGHIQSHNISHR